MSVLSEAKAAVAARKGEGSQLTAMATVLAKHGYAKKPVVSSSRYGATGSTVRVYHYKGAPGGDLVLITGPGIEGEVHDLASLDRQKAPKGFYVELGAGSEREERRVESALERAQRAAAGARARGRSSERARPERSVERKAARTEREVTVEVRQVPEPPRVPRITGAGRGGRAPYLPGFETVRGRGLPKMRDVRPAGKAPFLPGQEYRRGSPPAAAPSPSPSSDEFHMRQIEGVLKGILAQYGL